jgi:undecaprenyl-diphosphatase
VLALLLRRPWIFLYVLVADAVADLAAGAIKLAVPRHRPHLHHLVALPHSHSFPSGHTTTSFACATVLSALVPRLRVPALLLAVAIGYSRLYVGVHYPLDVIGGAVLGTLVATALLRIAEARRRSRPGRR